MMLLQPSGLWFLLGLPLIVVLYLIQSRYRPQVVASLLLWKRTARDLEADAAWRRPRWDVLLVLQLLVAAGVALALGRPAVFGDTGRRLVLVLDTSASMAARDVAPTRLAAAKQMIVDLAASAPADTRLSLVTAGRAPGVVAQDASVKAIAQALDGIPQESAAGDLVTALQVAASLAGDGDGSITVVTDGAFNVNLAPVAVPVTFETVGGGPQSLAVSDVSLRRPAEGGDYLAGFARVVNTTAADQTTTLAILADGVLMDRSPVQVPATGHADATFHVPNDAQTISVGLTDRGPLPAADRVDLLGFGHWSRNVVIVSDQPAFWQHVLSVVPNVTSESVRPLDFDAASASPNDIYLLDNVAPTPLPAGGLILVDPPEASALLSRADNLPRQRNAVTFDAEDPLLQGVDIAPLSVQRLERAITPGWAAAAVAAEDSPLILHGRLGQQPAVVLTFDPAHSNLPQLAAFPQLVANAIDWLTPGREAILQAGLGAKADIQPRPLADLPAQTDASLASAGSTIPHEVWPWFVAAAVALFGIEWAVAVRRG